jgi:hypothetical protein
MGPLRSEHDLAQMAPQVRSAYALSDQLLGRREHDPSDKGGQEGQKQ